LLPGCGLWDPIPTGGQCYDFKKLAEQMEKNLASLIQNTNTYPLSLPKVHVCTTTVKTNYIYCREIDVVKNTKMI
jgi:hypothetical protein